MIDPSKLGQMMSQVQNMQREMQEKLAAVKAEGQAGGGMVKVTLNGNMECESVSIDAACVDKEDVSMLQDLVQAAINDASRRIEEARADQAQSAIGSLGLPPDLLGGLGG
jgi:DNA-binding YbaB/EbfC family protein